MGDTADDRDRGIFPASCPARKQPHQRQSGRSSGDSRRWHLYDSLPGSAARALAAASSGHLCVGRDCGPYNRLGLRFYPLRVDRMGLYQQGARLAGVAVLRRNRRAHRASSSDRRICAADADLCRSRRRHCWACCRRRHSPANRTDAAQQLVPLSAGRIFSKSQCVWLCSHSGGLRVALGDTDRSPLVARSAFCRGVAFGLARRGGHNFGCLRARACDRAVVIQRFWKSGGFDDRHRGGDRARASV